MFIVGHRVVLRQLKQTNESLQQLWPAHTYVHMFLFLTFFSFCLNQQHITFIRRDHWSAICACVCVCMFPSQISLMRACSSCGLHTHTYTSLPQQCVVRASFLTFLLFCLNQQNITFYFKGVIVLPYACVFVQLQVSQPNQFA